MIGLGETWHRNTGRDTRIVRAPLFLPSSARKEPRKQVSVKKGAVYCPRVLTCPISFPAEYVIPYPVMRPARLERATCGLEGRCSIQLSYGPA